MENSENVQLPQGLAPEAMKRLEAAKSAQEKLANEIKEKMDTLAKEAKSFKDSIAKEHKDEVVGILILPPRPPQNKDEKTSPELLVLLEIEDENIEKLFDKKKKITDSCTKFAKSLKDTNISYLTLAELWDACKKGKYDILSLILMGMPIFDKGWVSAIRGVEMHKVEVIRKFEKYVICYVAVGSIIRGEVKEGSDIDTFVVIDDTDVTRMTAQELKTKLTSIIWGMAAQASMATNSKYKIHTQVYLLTDMWSSIHLAHPVIFTMIREGIPFYDRGLFMPWKLLLEKGHVKSTPEAIDGYVKSGKQAITRIKKKMEEIAVEDLFYAASIPAQGALMLIGEKPPVPWHTPEMFNEEFVKKRKLMSEKDAEILMKNLKLRKAFEHGKQKEVDPKVVVEHVEETEKFLEKIEKVFEVLQKEKVAEESKALYNRTVDDIKAALKLLGIKSSASVANDLKKQLIAKNYAPARFAELFEDAEKATKEKEFDREKIAALLFDEEKLATEMFDRIRFEKGSKLDKFKITVEYNNKIAGVWLLEDNAYVIMDVNNPKTDILSYKLTKEGSLIEPSEARLEDISEELKKFSGKPAALTDEVVSSIRRILGKNARIVLGA